MRTPRKSPSTFTIQKTAQSLQDGSAYPKPFRSQNRIGSKIRFGLCFATPRAKLAKFPTWYTTWPIAHLKTFPDTKTASLQKFGLLLLRNSASKARQISYMVHGTSVHGT